MKYSVPLLALATTALGAQVKKRGYYDYDNETTTLTTYTTVTTCPVTSTYTKEGSTYCVTDLTTSTIVVTECHGCGIKTVPGEDTTIYDHQTRYATRTTVCPVTETYTQEGHTYITTKTIEEIVPTTYIESVPGEDTTVYDHETRYATHTTVCPVTETYTEAGNVYTKTYITTKTIEEIVPTTYIESVPGEDTTVYDHETRYATHTTVCPVTETYTEAGNTYTKTYITTKTIEEVIPTTYVESIKLPDSTVNQQVTKYTTQTSLCPVTTTEYINGEYITKRRKVFTSTKIIVTQVPTVIHETKSLPGNTATEYEVEKTTITELVPVTSVETIHGEEKTITFTSTKVIVTEVPSVVEQTEFIPGETETAYQVQKTTHTELIPVTEVRTEKGEAITVTFTSTKVVIEKIPTTIEAIQTIYETDTNQEVQTKYSQVYYTVGGGTVVQTVPGKPTTYVVPKTSVVSVPPVTVTSEQAPPATSAPVEVPTGAAQANKAPVLALMAGVAGALALL
ncbi:Fc.00g109160.m01.CDS01 [Cosmosporella sp. VM-42]